MYASRGREQSSRPLDACPLGFAYAPRPTPNALQRLYLDPPVVMLQDLLERVALLGHADGTGLGEADAMAPATAPGLEALQLLGARVDDRLDEDEGAVERRLAAGRGDVLQRGADAVLARGEGAGVGDEFHPERAAGARAARHVDRVHLADVRLVAGTPHGADLLVRPAHVPAVLLRPVGLEVTLGGVAQGGRVPVAAEDLERRDVIQRLAALGVGDADEIRKRV